MPDAPDSTHSRVSETPDQTIRRLEERVRRLEEENRASRARHEKLLEMLDHLPYGIQHTDARGTILVAGRIERVDVLAKAEENSVRGVIAGSASGHLVDRLSAVRFPIVITEGFGEQAMAAPIFRLLQQSQSREASLFGRMDNGRPEIVIPLPASGRQEKPPPTVQPVKAGQQVRILRAPYAGRVGKVIAVHNRAQSTAIAQRMTGADVALSDGTVVFVPFTNLDLLI